MTPRGYRSALVRRAKREDTVLSMMEDSADQRGGARRQATQLGRIYVSTEMSMYGLICSNHDTYAHFHWLMTCESSPRLTWSQSQSHQARHTLDLFLTSPRIELGPY